VALLSAAEELASELAERVSAAAVATALLVVAHERIHREALFRLVHAGLIAAQVFRTPSPPARSVDSPWPPIPLVPSPASGPCEPSGLLYGFVACAGVLWLELAPMGASLVGRSHCETPVLIWTSVTLRQQGAGSRLRVWFRGGVRLWHHLQ
jgi:hypothetical protein